MIRTVEEIQKEIESVSYEYINIWTCSSYDKEILKLELEYAEALEKKDEELKSIWKDPKVELPEEKKEILIFDELCIKAGNYVNKKFYIENNGDYKDGGHGKDYECGIENWDFSYQECFKWCYEEDLIKQAKGE